MSSYRDSLLIKILPKSRNVALGLACALLVYVGQFQSVPVDHEDPLTYAEAPLPAPGNRLPFYIPNPSPIRTGNIVGFSLTNSPPTAADLGQTAEVDFSVSITSMAQSFNNDPTKIFEYVHNNIEYEPLAGSYQNASYTLDAQAGNSLAQSSLLIALLRAAGFHARYLTGQVTLSEDQMMSWLRVQTPEAADRRLVRGGIPRARSRIGCYYVGVCGPSNPNVNDRIFVFEHVWVAAYLPVESGGSVRTWYQLDPSYKTHTRIEGIDVPTTMGFNVNNFMNRFKSGATVTNDYAQTLNVSNATSDVNGMLTNLTNYLNDNEPNSSSGAVAGEWTINTSLFDELRDLEGAMPYETISDFAEFSAVPDSLRAKIRFQLSGINVQRTFPETVGRSLSLLYRGATPADQNRIDANGGVYGLQASGTSVVPVLSLDGNTLATGGASTLGQYVTAYITIHLPGVPDDDPVEKTMVTGGSYGMALTAQRSGRGGLDRKAEALRQRIAANSVVTTLYQDELETVPGTAVPNSLSLSANYLGESLSLSALQYFYQAEVAADVARDETDVQLTRYVGFGFAEEGANVIVINNAPERLDVGGLTLDIPVVWVGPTEETATQCCSASTASEKKFMLTTGFISSAFEGAVAQQLTYQTGVSTMKAINEAIRQNKQMYKITSANAGLISSLNLSASVKQQISAEVALGRTALVPGGTVTIDSWTGVGYVVLDPASGSAGYLISGGVNGGTATNPAQVIPKQFYPTILASIGYAKNLGTLALSAEQIIAAVSALFLLIGEALIAIFVFVAAFLAAWAASDFIERWVSDQITKFLDKTGGFVARDAAGQTVVYDPSWEDYQHAKQKHPEHKPWIDPVFRSPGTNRLEIWRDPKSKSGLHAIYVYKIPATFSPFGNELVYFVVLRDRILTGYVIGVVPDGQAQYSWYLDNGRRLACQWRYVGWKVDPVRPGPYPVHKFGRIPDAVPSPKPYNIDMNLHKALFPNGQPGLC